MNDHRAKRKTRDIGELGQDHFKAWCVDNGLNAVIARPDKLGWDILVEFDPEADSAIPLDRQSNLIKALVQVKSSTRKPGQSVQIKLSALKRLVDADMPTFVACLNYQNGKHRPSSARLLHIGQTEIEEVLRQVRENEKMGKKAINRVKVSLSLSRAILIESDGENLPDIIEGITGRNLATYISEKAAFRSKCGFGEASISGHLTLSSEIDESKIIDLMLGKIAEVPVEEMRITTSRFGIVLDNDIQVLTRGHLKIEVKPSESGKLRIFHKSKGAFATQLVDIYVPSLPSRDRGPKRVRIKNSLIDLDLDTETQLAQVNFLLDPQEILPIEELSDALAFAVALSQPDQTLLVDVEDQELIELKLGKKFVFYSKLNLYEEFIERLCIAAFKHRIISQLKISLNDAVQALDSQKDMFELMTKPVLKFTAERPEGAVVVPKPRYAISPICLKLASWIYYAILKIPMRPTTSKAGEMIFSGGAPELLEDGFQPREKFRFEKLNARASEICESLIETKNFAVAFEISERSSE